MGMRTRVAVLERLNQDLSIMELEIPLPRFGEVLVKIEYSGICGSQLMEISGSRGEDEYLPHLLGHEASGIVEVVGDGVTKVSPGDHVVVSWIRGNGIASKPAPISHNEFLIGRGAIATFGEHAVISENCVFPIGREIPLKHAALFGCAIPTGAGMVLNELPDDLSASTVGLFGLGGIGMSALHVLIEKKPKKIIVVDVSQEKLEIAKSLGLVCTINATDSGYATALQRESGTEGFDFTLDASGTVRGISQAFDSVKKFGGKCVFASHPELGQKIALDPFDLLTGKEIKGSWGGGVNLDKDLPALFRIFDEEKLIMALLSSKVYPFIFINQALKDFKEGLVLRPMLRMDFNDTH